VRLSRCAGEVKVRSTDGESDRVGRQQADRASRGALTLAAARLDLSRAAGEVILPGGTPLKSLLLVLLLPPVNLVFAILAGVVLLRVFPRLARWLIGVAALLLLALAMPAVAGTMLCALERDLPMTPPAGKPPGAIVILGADVAHTAQQGATVGPLTLVRLRAGAALQRETRLPVLVSGGVIGDDPPSVAELMRESLTQDFQVPVRWTEDKSSDTWENAQDSAAILRAAGIDSIYLVTHSWHERRALVAFAATGITVTAAPTPLDRPAEFVSSDFEPRAEGWEASYYALHEWIGYAWYALR
jgi:uncharacterized SAM-binding protein YcdF (DUF218 family)